VPLTEMELTEPGRCKERVREVFVQLVSVARCTNIYCVCAVLRERERDGEREGVHRHRCQDNNF
jgi:hypothetical protein